MFNKLRRRLLYLLPLLLIVLVTIRFVLIKPEAVFADSLFTFNEGYGSSINDASGAVSAGTITGAVWRTDDLCKREKCLYFDGSGDKVAFSDDVDLDFVASNTFTLSGWFRHPVIATNPDYLVTKHDAGVKGGYKVYMDSDGDLAFAIDDDGTWGPEDVIGDDQSKNYDDNQWHHFAAVKNGTVGIYLYVDGILVDQDTSLAASGNLENAASFHIGIDADGTSNAWEGFIDEVQVVRTARTQTQVITDYLGGNTTLTGSAPVGWWRMDEASWNGTAGEVKDYSGNGGDGVRCGNATTTTSGKFNNAGTFDGTGDCVQVTDNDALDITTAVTMSAWIYSTDQLNNYGHIVVKNSDSTWTGAFGYYRLIIGSNEGIRVEVGNNGDGFTGSVDEEVLESATSISTNSWNHVAGIYDGQMLKIYINGQLTDTKQLVGFTMGTSTQPLHIGINDDTGDEDVDGRIDDVRVYNYARSSTQILEDMAGYSPPGTTASFGPDQSYLSNGLVAYWRMEESATPSLDSSGGNNSGTWNGNVASAVGKFGSATTFDGTGDYVSTSDFFHSDSLTICAWINGTTLDANVRTIVAKRNSSGVTAGDAEWAFTVSSGKLQYTNWDSGASTIIDATANTTLSTGTWYHGCIVQNGANKPYSFFLNGAIDGSGTQSSSTTRNTTSLIQIGVRTNNNDNRYWNGKIDDVRIYNRALSPTEVAKLYSWAPGPVGYWKMDENTGTTANDSSSNGNNGTLQGSVSWTTGKFGSATYYSDASNTYISTSITNNPTAFSASAWIYPCAVDAVNDSIITKFESTNGFFLRRNSSSLQAVIADGSEHSVYAGSLAVNRWDHAAATYDGNTLILYQNGVEIGRTTGAMVGSSNALAIGGNYGGTLERFCGNIDDVRYYNYARTPGQIIEDMNGGHPSPGSPIGSAVGYWQLDEGYGTTAYDNSVNDNNLTLSAAGWTNSGKFGKAYDGASNRRLTRNDDADFDFTGGTDDFTLSLWFNRGGAISAQEYLLDKHSTNDGYDLYMDSDGDIVCGIGDGVSLNEDTAGTTAANYDDTSWHHAVCVKSGTSSLRLYIDGKEVASDTSIAADGDMSNTGKLIVGDTDEADGTDEWLGDIDEIYIYRSALSADSVKALYNRGFGEQLGATSTNYNGGTITPSNSAADEYCPPGQASACTTPTGEWKLDENTGTTANDSSGNNYVGTFSGSPSPLWSSGKLGAGVTFDGTTAHRIDVGDLAGLEINDTEDFTITGWIKTRSISGADTIAVKKQATVTSTGTGYYALLASGKLDLIVADGTDFYELEGSTTLSTNTWYHVALVWDQDSTANTKVYVNGKDDGGTVCPGAPAGCTSTIANIGDTTGTGLFSIGATDGGSRIFDGTLDNIRFYKYAMNPAQIAWDYNRGKPIAHWQMDETSWNNNCSTDTVFDYSGNGFHGDACPSSTGPTGGATGKINNGGTFDGSNDYINMGDPSGGQLDFGTSTDFSISAWIKTAGDSEIQNIVDKRHTSGNFYGYHLSVQTNGTLIAHITDVSTVNVTATSSISVADNSWHHVAAVYDRDGLLQLYIDGIPNNSANISTVGDISNGGSFIIGDGNVNVGASSIREFSGTLDDVRVYNYPLTSQQVQAVMNNGSATKF